MVKPEARRELVYNEHGAWVDTRAIHVDLNDVPSLDENSKQLATVIRNHYKKEERVMPKQEFELDGERKGNDLEIGQIEKKDDEKKTLRSWEESTAPAKGWGERTGVKERRSEVIPGWGSRTGVVLLL